MVKWCGIPITSCSASLQTQSTLSYGVIAQDAAVAHSPSSLGKSHVTRPSNQKGAVGCVQLICRWKEINNGCVQSRSALAVSVLAVAGCSIARTACCQLRTVNTSISL